MSHCTWRSLALVAAVAAAAAATCYQLLPGRRHAAAGVSWYGTAFDHAHSMSPASIAFADPARAGSVRMSRAGRGDTAT